MDLLDRINATIKGQGKRSGNELMWRNQNGIEICFKQEIVSRLEAQVADNKKKVLEVKYFEAVVIADYPIPSCELFSLQLSSPKEVRVMGYNYSFEKVIQYLENLPTSHDYLSL